MDITLALQSKLRLVWFWFRDIESGFTLTLTDTPQLGDSLHVSFRLTIGILNINQRVDSLIIVGIVHNVTGHNDFVVLPT